MGEEGSVKSKDEEEDLLKSSDEDENNVTTVKDTFLEDFNSFIDEGDKLSETVVNIEATKVASKKADVSYKACNSSFINFQPTVQSTPNRPSTSGVSRLQPMPSIIEEEEDYSILYEGAVEDDDQFQTLHLDQLNENLDFSLLYSDNESNEESDEVTVVEVSDEAKSSSGTKTNATTETKNQATHPPKVTKKTSKKPREDTNDFLKMSIWKVREKYYHKAVSLWKQEGVQDNKIPNLRDRRLRMPMIYKDKNGKIIGGEGPEEWADKVRII